MMTWKDLCFYGVIGILSPILLAYHVASLRSEKRRH